MLGSGSLNRLRSFSILAISTSGPLGSSWPFLACTHRQRDRATELKLVDKPSRQAVYKRRKQLNQTESDVRTTVAPAVLLCEIMISIHHMYLNSNVCFVSVGADSTIMKDLMGIFKVTIVTCFLMMKKDTAESETHLNLNLTYLMVWSSKLKFKLFYDNITKHCIYYI